MAEAELNIVVKMRDQATAGLRGLGTSIAALGRYTPTITGVGRAINGIGIAAAAGAVGGVAAIGVGLGVAAKAGLGFNNDMEQARAAINAFTKDSVATEALLEKVEARAKSTPFAFNEMAQAAAGLQPVMRASGESFEELISKAEILAAANPAEGLTGAVFALREAASGDMASIIERFNLSRTTLNQLKEEGVPALEAVQIAMQEMGYDASLVANMAETASGRWSTFQDILTGLAGQITQPIFDTFSAGLGNVNAMLEDNMPMLEGFARGIGEWIGGAIDWVVNTGVPNFLTAFDAIRSVIEGFATGNFDVLPLAELLGLDTANEIIPTLEGIRDQGVEAIQRVREAFGLAKDAVTTFIDAFTGDWENVPGKIDPVHQVAGELGLTFGKVAAGVADIVKAISGSEAQWDPLNENMIEGNGAATDLTSALTNVAKGISDTRQGLENMLGPIDTWGEKVLAMEQWLNDVATAFQNAGKTINEWMTDVTTVMVTVTTSVSTAQTNIGTALIRLGASFTTLANNIKTAVDTAVTNISRILIEIGRVAAEAYNKAVSIGTNIIAGIKAGLADPGGTISSIAAGLVTKAINAAKSAGVIRSPSQKAADEVGKPIAEGIAAGMSEGEQDAAKAAADLVNSIGSALQSALKGLGALAAYDEGALYEDALYGFGEDLLRVLDVLRSVAGQFDAEGAETAAKIASSIGDIVGIVGDAVSSIAALQNYDADRLYEDALYGFGDDLTRVVKMLDDVADQFERDGLVAAAEIYEAVGTVLGVVEDAVDAIASLRDYDEGALFEDALYGFGDDLARVVTVLSSVASQFEQEGMAAAALFATAAGDVVGVIGDAVKAIGALRDYDEGALYEDALHGFGEDLERVVRLMGEIAERFEEDGMIAAIALANTAASVVAPIGDAVKAFEALQTIQGVPPERMEILAANLYQAVWWMEEIAKGMNKDGLVAAVGFSMAVGEVFKAMGGAIKVIEDLRDLEGVPPERFEAFAGSIMLAVEYMDRIAKAAGPMLQNAEDWRDDMEDLAAAIAAGIKALETIGQMPDMPDLPGGGGPPPPTGEQPRQPLTPAMAAMAAGRVGTAAAAPPARRTPQPDPKKPGYTPWWEIIGWDPMGNVPYHMPGTPIGGKPPVDYQALVRPYQKFFHEDLPETIRKEFDKIAKDNRDWSTAILNERFVLMPHATARELGFKDEADRLRFGAEYNPNLDYERGQWVGDKEQTAINITINAPGADSSVDTRIRAMIPEIARALNATFGNAAAGRR